ncbi:MAG: permease-like cell division protein FtsX [Desulfobacterales bacterium]
MNRIALHVRRAVKDMDAHRLLNLVTMTTVALTILILGAASLFFLNLSDLLTGWKQGIRIMVYLDDADGAGPPSTIETRIRQLPGVEEVRFVSKAEALDRLKSQMERQSAVLNHLEGNPLPDAFDVRMKAVSDSWERIEKLAGEIEAMEGVDEVEYGQRWVNRFIHLFNLFQLTGYAMGGLMILASVFIVGNTIRLVYYSRQEEVEIMRLVGATDQFILIPFYIQGLLQGLIGGLTGMAALLFLFQLLTARVGQTGWLQLRFLPMETMAMIVFASMAVGGLGCHLSLKQHFKS